MLGHLSSLFEARNGVADGRLGVTIFPIAPSLIQAVLRGPCLTLQFAEYRSSVPDPGFGQAERLPFISSPRVAGGMERSGHCRWAQSPSRSAVGIMQVSEHAAVSVRSGSPRLGQAADLAVSQSVVDEVKKFARRGHASHVGAPALLDPGVELGHRRVAGPRDGLDGGPAHQA